MNMIMNMIKHLCVGTMLLSLTACYTAPDQTSPFVGKAVQNNMAQQIVPPSVAEPAGPPDMNGIRATGAIGRYVIDKTTPLENFSTLTAGGGGGGGAAPSGGGAGLGVGASIPAPAQ